MVRHRWSALGCQVLQIIACAAASALAQTGAGTVTVIQNKNSDVAMDWLIVLATALGALLLLILLLVELWRCCRLDCRRRRVRRKLRAGVPAGISSTGRSDAGLAGATTIDVDNDAQLQKALALSRITAQVEEEERHLRMAIDASLGYSVPKQATSAPQPTASSRHSHTTSVTSFASVYPVAEAPYADTTSAQHVPRSRHSYTPSVSSVASYMYPAPGVAGTAATRVSSYTPSISSASAAPLYPASDPALAYAPPASLYPSADTAAPAGGVSVPSPAYTPYAADAYGHAEGSGVYPGVNGGEVEHGYDPYAAPRYEQPEPLYPKAKPRPPPRNPPCK